MARRPRTGKERTELLAASGHLSPSKVAELVEGRGGVTFDEARQDYRDQMDAGDQNNRFMRRRVGLGGSGDYHIPEQRLWYVRETSRHMVLNDDLIGQSMTRLADNIVQDAGFRLVPMTGDPGLDVEIAARHRAWAEDPEQCDFYGERTFAQLQWIVQFQMDQDGDVFPLAVDNGTIQVIEADRCTSAGRATTDEYLGLLLDPAGKVMGYRFTTKPLGPYQPKAYGDTIVKDRYDDEGFEQVMHCYDSRRVTQHRGMPLMTPVMIKAGMLDDLQFATVVKAQSSAAHAVLLKRSADSSSGTPPRMGARGTTTISAPDGSTQTAYTDALRYGQTTVLPKGLEPVITQPIPSSEHLQHVRAVIQQIGAAMGLPIELVLLDASNTNFSGWRGAMDAARMGFRRRQKGLIAQFHCPTHRLNVRRWAYDLGAVARAKLRDGSIYGHRWVPAAWPYINPKDDAEAAQILMRSGQDSPRGIVAKRGEDYDDVVRETVESRSSAIRQALVECDKLEADHGFKCSPFVLLGWDLPGNAALVANADEMANAGTPAPAPTLAKPPAPTADTHDTISHGPDAAPGATPSPAESTAGAAP